jgi:hypothetical protein
MKRTLLFGFLLFTVSLSAQTEKEIGIVISPANINMVTDGEAAESIYTVNYGVRGIITWDRVSVNAGILHLTQGSQNSTSLGQIVFRAKGISLPVGIDYNFINNDATKVFGGIGLHTAYICCQNTTIETNDSKTKLPKSDNNAFESLYFGLNLGLGIKQKLNDKFNLLIRPNYIHQLRSSTQTINNLEINNPKFRSFALDLGLLYRLKSN